MIFNIEYDMNPPGTPIIQSSYHILYTVYHIFIYLNEIWVYTLTLILFFSELVTGCC